MIKVAVFPIHEAKRIQSKLKENIDIELRHDEKTCTRGCTVTVEVWVAQEQVDDFVHFIKEEEKSLVDEADWDTVDSEIDLNAETAICPACSSEFSPKTGECSNCGLRFF